MVTQDPFGIGAQLAAAAAAGQPVTAVHHVQSSEIHDVVVLDPIAAGPAGSMPYCVHGRTTCGWCREWCWLGDRTHQLVATGAAAPICKPCANRLIPQDHPRATNAGDHLRADGPH